MSIAEAEAPTGAFHPNDTTPMKADVRAERAARRQAERGGPQNERAEQLTIKARLAAERKVTIRLYQRPPSEEQLGRKFVGYQGEFFLIQRGVRVNVPESIYKLLVASGDIAAENDEDEALAPSRTWAPLGQGGKDNYISQQAPIDLI